MVIAMAGVMKIEDWHQPETFLDSAESVIATNVLGPIRLIASFVEHLQKQPEPPSSPCPPASPSHR